jgi:hypothetical protein
VHHKEHNETNIQSAPHPGDPFPNRSHGRYPWEDVFVHRTQPSLPEPPSAVGSSPQRQHQHPGRHQQARPNPGLGYRSRDTTSRHRLLKTFKERGEILHEDLAHPGCSPQASRYRATQSPSGHHFKSLKDAKCPRNLTLSSDGKPVGRVNHRSWSSDHNTARPTHEPLHSVEPKE